jgi:hypothetical protein
VRPLDVEPADRRLMIAKAIFKLLLHVANTALATHGVATFGGTDLVVDEIARGERPLPGEHAGAWGGEAADRAIGLVEKAPLDLTLLASAFARGGDARSAAGKPLETRSR